MKKLYVPLLIVLLIVSCDLKDNTSPTPTQGDITLYWNSLKNAVNYENYEVLNQLISNPVCIYNYNTGRSMEYDKSYIYSIMDALNTSAKDFINSYNPRLKQTQKLSEINCSCIVDPDTTSEYYIYEFKHNGKDNYLIFRLTNTTMSLKYAKLEFNQSSKNEEIEYEKKLRFFDFYKQFKELLISGVKENIADHIIFRNFYINDIKMNRYLFHKNFTKEYPIVPKNQFGNSLQEFLNVNNDNIHISKNGENGIYLEDFDKGERIIYIDIKVNNSNNIRRYFFVIYDNEEYSLINTELISS